MDLKLIILKIWNISRNRSLQQLNKNEQKTTIKQAKQTTTTSTNITKQINKILTTLGSRNLLPFQKTHQRKIVSAYLIFSAWNKGAWSHHHSRLLAPICSWSTPNIKLMFSFKWYTKKKQNKTKLDKDTLFVCFVASILSYFRLFRKEADCYDYFFADMTT